MPAGAWFAQRLEAPAGPGHFSLTGVTVAPGWRLQDIQAGQQDRLVQQFPQHENIIRSFYQ